MYASIIKMATLHESSRTDWDGKPFWGLVQQDGPWRATKSDYERARMKDRVSLGGGKAAGGRGHAGHGEWLRVFTPYQINATGAPHPPSGYAMRNVMMDSVDMKRQTKMGRVKTGLTLHARTPMQTGHKMGNASEEIREMEAGDMMPPVRTEAMPGFTSTHHIMEMSALSPASSTSSTDIDSEGGPKNIMHFGIPVEQVHVPTISQHMGYSNQAAASTTAINDERKRKMSELINELGKRRKGPGEPGPSSLGKHNLPISSTITKRHKSPGEPGPSILGKRKASINFMKKGKNARTIFKGPLHPETHNKAEKRKALSEAGGMAKKQNRKPGKINTSIGKRFGEGKAEKKSAPKKYDELPEVRPKRSKK